MKHCAENQCAQKIIYILILGILFVGDWPNLYLFSNCNNRIVIDHDIIKLIDGTPQVDILRIMKLEQGLTHLQDGQKLDNGFRYFITYKGKKYSSKQLVELEKKGPHKELRKALDGALDQIEELSRDYLKENRAYKTQMVKLLKQWATQRNRPNSQLLEWGNQKEGHEYDNLRKASPTFKACNQFISDLLCFLKDMRFSCTESWKHFKEEYKNENH